MGLGSNLHMFAGEGEFADICYSFKRVQWLNT